MQKMITLALTTLAVFSLALAARALTISTSSDTMTNASISAGSDHDIRFVTPSGVSAGGTVTVRYALAFDLTPLVLPDDIDLLEGDSGNCTTATFTNKALAASPSGATWGVGLSATTLTFTSGTDTITAGHCMEIRVGENASFGATGTHRAVNPSVSAQYSIVIGGTFGDTGTISVFIMGDDTVAVSAVVESASGTGGGGGGGGGGGTPNPPVLSNIRVQNITETTADVLWDTDVSSSSTVNYGLTAAYGSDASTAGNTFNHTVSLSGLTAGTLYHFRVRSTGTGGETVSGDFTFTTLDLTPPVISNVQATNITGTSAHITWDTNEDSTSKVDYGLTTAYGSVVSNATLVNAHGLDVSGLTPNTLYHFKVTSVDASGNSASSADFTFTTLDTIPPVISNIFADNITQTGARVNWTTDELATSLTAYGVTVSYGSTTQNSTPVANHQLTLSGLIPGTLYHYIVNSRDASGNSATSTDQTFTTLVDNTPPANVSNFTAAPGNAQNTLSWTNPPDADFTGVKIVRKLGSYPTGPNDGTTVFNGLATSTVDSGLVNGTTYFYAAFAHDASSNFASGALASGTPNDGVAPGTPTNLSATPSDAQVQLSWTNPGDPDLAYVRLVRKTGNYPATPTDGTIIYQGLAQTDLDTGLVNGTTYYYALYARDTSNNFSAPATANATPFAPPPPPPVCGNAICETGENATSCPADCAAPPPQPVCGNSVCEPGETAASCPADCAVTPQPPLPPVVQPPPSQTPSRFDAAQVQEYSASRTVLLNPDASGAVHTPIGQTLTVIIPDTAFKETPQQIVLNLASSSYLFAKSKDGLSWAVDVAMPKSPATLLGTIIVGYADGTSDTAPLTIDAEARGLVIVNRNGQDLPLEGASVTLQRQGNGFIVWNATPFAQTNPQTTTSDGTFGYVAPSGTYQLIAEKDGYRRYASAPFDVTTNVIAQRIELIELPPTITDVIVPGASVTQNVFNVSRAIGTQTTYITKVIQNEVIQDPRVSNAAQQYVVPAAAIITTGVVITAVQVTSLVNYLYFLLTQPLLLIGRRKRKEYGVVYNALTKLPVDLAIVRLVRADGRLVRTLVTDKLGRYTFLVDQGSYRLEVSKQNFEFPSRFLVGRREDGKYLDLYHGEAIAVGGNGAIITANIPLDPADVPKTARRLLLEDLGRKVQNALAPISVLITLLAFALYRQPILLAASIFQLLLYMVFRRLARPKQPKNWGIVYDAKTKKPVPFAVARIVETQYNKVLESRVTDARGRYSFLVGNNKYYVSAEKAGYETTKTPEIDLSKASQGEGVVDIDIGLNPKP